MFSRWSRRSKDSLMIGNTKGVMQRADTGSAETPQSLDRSSTSDLFRY